MRLPHSTINRILAMLFVACIEKQLCAILPPMKLVTLSLPEAFSFDLSISFLLRSPKELLHRVEGKSVVKLLYVHQRPVLFRVSEARQKLQIDFLSAEPTVLESNTVKQFVREWFDLDTDLKPFYQLAAKDALLRDLVKQFHGYRIIGQPDLFESLIWAVLGQQINLSFAYSLKQRFVERFGGSFSFEQQPYYSFPTAEVVALLGDDDLLPLQFSRQKSKYVVLIAKAFAEGMVSKEKLRGLTLQQAKEKLMQLKGVGNWTANYALMKTFRHPDAFPLEDVAIHNAIKNLKGMKAKPTLDQVKRIFKKYKGWEAYATLYLWKSL
jgi:DNA-3-methyladenine glycosylase II